MPVLYLGNVYPKVISPLEVNCPSFSLFMVLFQQTWLLIDGLDAFLLVFFFLRHFLVSQGSYRSWKTWKVMEFQNFIFHAWKVMEFNCRFLKFMESDKVKTTKRGQLKNSTHFGGHQSLCLLNFVRSKNKTKKVFD